jgi:hypothetical protein
MMQRSVGDATITAANETAWTTIVTAKPRAARKTVGALCIPTLIRGFEKRRFWDRSIISAILYLCVPQRCHNITSDGGAGHGKD